MASIHTDNLPHPPGSKLLVNLCNPPIVGQAILFLMAQATALGLPMRVFNAGGDPTKPVAVITWEGSEPALPSIELNSHMDVVPADPSLWTHPPYAADIDEAGRIFGRGTQDMKSVGMQYLAAIKALRAAGVRNKRTVHVTFVPGLLLCLHSQT